jgi:hypothetical protein
MLGLISYFNFHIKDSPLDKICNMLEQSIIKENKQL